MKKSKKGFVLLEVMLAVGIFAAGVIGLGACVSNGMNAEIVRSEDARARLALSNRMAEIERGAVKVDVAKSEELKGLFEGMVLKQSAKPWTAINEKQQAINGISEVTLEVSWVSGRQPQSKSISFYVSQG